MTVEMTITLVVQVAAGDLSVFSWCKAYARRVLESFWFLWAMFWCSAIVTVVERVFAGRWLAYTFALGVSLLWPNSFNLTYTSYMLPFFLTGYLLRKLGLHLGGFERKRAALCLAFASVAYVAIALNAWDRGAYIYSSGTCLLGASDPLAQLWFDILRVLQGFLGIAATACALSLLGSIAQRPAGRVLASLGKASLVVYILNVYTNRVLPVLPIQGPSPFVWVTLSMLLLFVYWAAYKLVGRLPWLNFLAFGGSCPREKAPRP